MIIGIPKETLPGERRVALVPETVQRLVAQKLSVAVESGAGLGAWIDDDDYRSAGANIEPSARTLLARCDLIVKIRPPAVAEVERLKNGAALACLLYPRLNLEVVRRLAAGRVTAIAMDRLPRTTIAQCMDVLSSQSTIAGYRAVILAANALAKFFPLLMTPAGSIAPARVLILGAGVAGLQAIATARRLGARVEAFDVRAAVREEVESLGAKFISCEIFDDLAEQGGYAHQLSDRTARQVQAIIGQSLANADVCITSALIPDARAPVLITRDMVRRMRPGSVIVDLASEQGGNCEFTEPGRDLLIEGIAVFGRLDLPSELAVDASRMYSRNMEKLIEHFVRDGVMRLDFQDEIARRCVVTHDGSMVED